ncbi:unnamed protein product [Lepeophtheirus salmonis]|uniref:(salmon louse) hypothetical protein n=1 Tax=Lepeophtheirus salmonis TaxID=72036 RepID=A0A7R8CJ21_LEPSM|nr:unnamed protein product [Lepeophtheirus salmonis]CAF2836791.1 unnamed protein product [Lepeophtheirus salmonis]
MGHDCTSKGHPSPLIHPVFQENQGRTAKTTSQFSLVLEMPVRYVAKSRLYAPMAMWGLRSNLDFWDVRLKTNFNNHTHPTFEERISTDPQEFLKTTMGLDGFWMLM